MSEDPADRSGRGVYGISVAAELSGIGEQSLRLYEHRGLLTPARSAGGTRRYSEDDLARLQRITELLAAGVNVAGIGQILALQDRNTQLESDNTALESDNTALEFTNARLASAHRRAGAPQGRPPEEDQRNVKGNDDIWADEVPEADRADQQIPVDPADDDGLDLIGQAAASAAEADLIDQSLTVTLPAEDEWQR